MTSRRIALVALVVGLTTSTASFAQLGGLVGGKSSGGGDVGAQVVDFLKRTVVISTLSTNALASINAAFASDSELAAKRKEQEELASITDPKEKQARAAKIYESESAAAEKLAKSDDLQQRMNGLDAEKKKKIGAALLNFGISALQAPGLLKSAQGIVQGVTASPMDLPKVVPVKDAMPFLSKIATDAGSTIATFVKVAQGANISVPQATADSKPVETTL